MLIQDSLRLNPYTEATPAGHCQRATSAGLKVEIKKFATWKVGRAVPVPTVGSHGSPNARRIGPLRPDSEAAGCDTRPAVVKR